jgi:hypothetical protein
MTLNLSESSNPHTIWSNPSLFFSEKGCKGLLGLIIQPILHWKEHSLLVEILILT